MESSKSPRKTRFRKPVSPRSMERICKGAVPTNRKKVMSWAFHVFEEWRKQCNEAAKMPDEKCLLKLLEEPKPRSLNCWLSRFVLELRRADGNPYPPSSISNILAGLYRYSKSQVPDCPNFMDRKNNHFCELTGALQV